MLTVSWRGATECVFSRHSVKIGDVFDSSYELVSLAPGLPFFEARWHETGFELWAGRRHLIVEVPPLARIIRTLAVRIADSIANTQALREARDSPEAPTT